MIYMVRHIPTGFFLTKNGLTWKLSNKGKKWGNKVSFSYFVHLDKIYHQNKLIPFIRADFQIVRYELIETGNIGL